MKRYLLEPYVAWSFYTLDRFPSAYNGLLENENIFNLENAKYGILKFEWWTINHLITWLGNFLFTYKLKEDLIKNNILEEKNFSDKITYCYDKNFDYYNESGEENVPNFYLYLDNSENQDFYIKDKELYCSEKVLNIIKQFENPMLDITELE